MDRLPGTKRTIGEEAFGMYRQSGIVAAGVRVLSKQLFAIIPSVNGMLD